MEKIEKYKLNIEKMLNKNIKEIKCTIESFLNLEFKNHKISEKEYNELLDFLNEKTKETEDTKETEKDVEKQDSNIEEEIKNAFFRMQLKVEPIYKGKIGKVAPKRKIEKELNSDEQEGR